MFEPVAQHHLNQFFSCQDFIERIVFGRLLVDMLPRHAWWEPIHGTAEFWGSKTCHLDTECTAGQLCTEILHNMSKSQRMQFCTGFCMTSVSKKSLKEKAHSPQHCFLCCFWLKPKRLCKNKVGAKHASAKLTLMLPQHAAVFCQAAVHLSVQASSNQA